MASQSVESPTRQGNTARYVAPFLVFLGALAVFDHLPIAAEISAPLWFLLLLPVCVICWPREVTVLPSNPLGSVAVGALAFVVWITPDLLIPGYRNLPLFSNGFIGHVHSSLPETALRSWSVLAWRTARAVIIVPIVEELFWRGWLMRWLIDTDFARVPLGSYSPLAFCVTALLFAAEHGPYWDVGLLTGFIYNFWMIRTNSLANCVLMHAATNALLCIYVIGAGQWQYWQ